MKKTSNIRAIINEQKKIIDNLENEVYQIEQSDLTLENEKLNQKLTKVENELNQTISKAEKTGVELAKYKNALTAQLLEDKLSTLESVNLRINRFYLATSENEQNRLLDFETSCKNRIKAMYDKLSEVRFSDESEMKKSLTDFEMLLDQKIFELKKLERELQGSFEKEKKQKYDELHEESITKEELEKSISRKSWESFVGLNIFNKVGIFLIVIGTIAAGQYTFTKIGDLAKSLVIFLLGLGLIAAGEIITKRKHANVFSQGLISGGVAILYVATIVTYFVLNLISSEMTFALCAIITGIAFALSMIHRSQTISAFAIIGGYLPLLSLFISDMDSLTSKKAFLPVIISYLCVLSLFTFLISIKNRWTASLFIGFSLNTVAIAGVAFLSNYMVIARDNKWFGLIPIAFAVFSMMVYMIDVFLGARKSEKLTLLAFILVIINTTVSSISLFALTNMFFSQYLYLVPILLTAVFALLSWFAITYLSDDKNTKGVFLGVAIAFSFLIVPITWGAQFWALSWIVESAAILIIGTQKDIKFIKISGYITFALSIFSFLLLDISMTNVYTLNDSGKYFEVLAFSYPVLIIASFLIIFISICEQCNEDIFYKVLTYFTAFNFVGFLVYAVLRLGKIYLVVKDSSTGISFENSFAIKIILSILIFASVVGASFVRDICDRVMDIILSTITFGTLMFLGVTFLEESIDFDLAAMSSTILNLTLMAIAFIVAVVAVFFIVRTLTVEFDFTAQILPIVTSIVFVTLLTIILITQFGLKFTSPVISIVYVIAASLWIVLGFIKKYSSLRKSGLILSFLSLAKLFVIDLFGLPILWRIISFFAFGGILIAVSFVYQYFNKRLESEELVSAEKDKE